MNRLSNVSSAVATLAVMAAFCAIAPAATHHSHSMFDLTTTQTVTGSVKTFVFQNPHVYLFVDVANGDDGKPKPMRSRCPTSRTRSVTGSRRRPSSRTTA